MSDRSNFKEGYDLIMENAKVHFSSAKILADQGHYGVANSLLILSSEELIKAYIVYAQHYDHDLVVENFKKLFSDHKYKHNLLKDITFWFSFMNQMMDIIITPAEDLYNKKGKKLNHKEIMSVRKRGLDNLVSWLKGIPSIDSNESWWDAANSRKNTGFYVNLQDGNWLTPKLITKENYEESYKIVNDLMDRLELIPGWENDPELAKVYQDFKDKSKK